MPPASSRSAIMREVVVLPLVPATITTPWSRRAVSLLSRLASTRSATNPGAEVPPPRPTIRIPLAVALATSSAADRRRSVLAFPLLFLVIRHDHPYSFQLIEINSRPHFERDIVGSLGFDRITDHLSDHNVRRHAPRLGGSALRCHDIVTSLRLAFAVDILHQHPATLLPLPGHDAIGAALHQLRSDRGAGVDDQQHLRRVRIGFDDLANVEIRIS